MSSFNRFGSNNLTHLWVIMILNFVVFMMTTFNSKLIYVVGLSPATFLNQPWTILTSMFTHSGLWHILANMLTLYFFGSFLTRLIGEGRMITIYMIGGLFGNFLYLLINFLMASYFSIAVGASGAVFALGGALAILAPNVKVVVFPIPVPISLWIAVIGGFFILSLMPGIAWEGHLGGLIVGLIAGLIMKKQVRTSYY